MKRVRAVDGVRNETDKPVIPVDDQGWADPDPLQPGYIRFYEFLHGYRDEPIGDYEVKLARHRAVMDGTAAEPTNEEMMGKILTEEIQAEINRSIIDTILGKKK